MDGPGPSPTAPAPPDPAALTAESSAAEVRERTTATNGVHVALLGQPATVEDRPPGSTWLGVTASGTAGEEVLALLVTAEGTRATVGVDGSATVRDAAGTVVLGLAPPESTIPAAFRAAAPDVLRLVAVDAPAGTEVSAWWSTAAIASTSWGEREGGRSLAVVPTEWARAAGDATAPLAAEQLRALGEEAATPTMLDQLVCHTIGAPDKEQWNLEPWRPEVGLLPTMAALCNPTA